MSVLNNIPDHEIKSKDKSQRNLLKQTKKTYNVCEWNVGKFYKVHFF